MRLHVKYRSKKFFRLIILLLFSCCISVQAQHLILKNFKLKDGLPSTEVYCAFQDSKGFIWFGTDGGVSRFDGHIFKNYTTEDGLADNVVFGITEDRHGRIWFRSLSGKLCYMENDSICRIEANELIVPQMKNALMVSFYVDSADTVWCGLQYSGGYFKIAPGYRAKDFKFVKVKLKCYVVQVEDKGFIHGVVFFKRGENVAVVSLYKKEVLQKSISVPGFFPAQFYCNSSVEDTVLVADHRELVSVLQDSIRILLEEKDIGSKITFLKNAGNYSWLGLMRRGVLRCAKNEALSWKKNVRILDGYSVSDVMIDKEGGTWFTTLENGVYYSSPMHFVSYQDYNQFSAYECNNFAMAGKDHFFMSQEPGLVDIVSPDSISRNVKINDPRLNGLLERSGVASFMIATGNMYQPDGFRSWMWTKGGSMKKILLIDHKSEFPSRISFYTEDTLAKTAYAIDRFWFFELNKPSGKMKIISTLPSRTLGFFYDKTGTLWLGCLDGLWSYEKNKFVYHGNEHEFLKYSIEDIREDRDGTRYYATRGNGIIICKNGVYTKLTTANGLSSNNCKCIYIDESNAVWIGSKNGICRLVSGPVGWKISKYDLTDNEFSFEVLKMEKIKKTLWLFTSKGLLTCNPVTDEAGYIPPIYITQFLIDEASHLKDSIRIFNHDENSVSISYIALSFQNPGKLYYSYKLEGLDTAWYTTQNTRVRYPYLPPGNYKFYIKAVSFNGAQNELPAVITFTIKKPFWLTFWFIAGVFLFAVAGGYLFFRYRFRILRKKEEEKTRISKLLTEFEMRSLRSQMNPHFIFNVINSIQSYIVRNDRKTAQDYLAKFARLIRNVLENSKQETISLTNEIETLKIYIELEQLRSPGKFSFNVEVRPGLQMDLVKVPPLIFQPYAENAILHGLLPLEGRQGILNIILERKENRLVCIIDDNGIGRKRANELKQKKQFYHRSMGLSVTEDRIKMVGGLQSGESGIVTEDKMDSSGEGTGTRVIITIKLKN